MNNNLINSNLQIQKTQNFIIMKTQNLKNIKIQILLFVAFFGISMAFSSCEKPDKITIEVKEDIYLTEITNVTVVNNYNIDTTIIVNNYGNSIDIFPMGLDDERCEFRGGLIFINTNLLTGEVKESYICAPEDGEDGNNGEDGRGFVFEIEEVTYIKDGRLIEVTYVHFYWDNGDGVLNKDDDEYYDTLVITTSESLERSKTIYHYNNNNEYLGYTYIRYLDINNDGDYTEGDDELIGDPIVVAETRYYIKETTGSEGCNGTLTQVYSIQFEDSTEVYSNCKEETPEDYDQITDTVKIDDCWYIYSWIEKDFVDGFTSGDEEKFSILISCDETDITCTKYFEEASFDFNSPEDNFTLQDGLKFMWGLLIGMFDDIENSGFTTPTFSQMFESGNNLRMLEFDYGSKKDHTFRVIVIKNDDSEVLLETVIVEGLSGFYKMDPNKYRHYVRFYDFDDERTQDVKAIRIEVIKDEAYGRSHSDMLSLDNMTISSWFNVCEE